jgi:phosphomannomutase
MLEDYKKGVAINLFTNEEEVLSLPKSDVLIYYTEDGTKIAARPSGTEPKIKFYVSVNCTIFNISEIEAATEFLDNKIKNIITEMQLN